MLNIIASIGRDVDICFLLVLSYSEMQLYGRMQLCQQGKSALQRASQVKALDAVAMLAKSRRLEGG